MTADRKEKFDRWLVNLAQDHPVRFWLLVIGVTAIIAIPLCKLLDWSTTW